MRKFAGVRKRSLSADFSLTGCSFTNSLLSSAMNKEFYVLYQKSLSLMKQLLCCIHLLENSKSGNMKRSAGFSERSRPTDFLH